MINPYESPNVPEDKPFVGQLLYLENFDKDVPRLGWAGLDPTDLVVVAKPQNILREWWFVVVDGNIVSGSRYSTNVQPARMAWDSLVDYFSDTDAHEFATEIVKIYNPDNVWVLDVAQTAGNEYKVVEISCFSCSGLYNNDKATVVTAVNRSAVAQWKQDWTQD